ncbi:hypothetical protein SAMN05443247_04271 [Bradyrhizobium erythrophlei]|jgi:hypothetical protein|nr:hypothetical protein SAMN05443247_04271 [Bradyrhizobium erythrophlei]
MALLFSSLIVLHLVVLHTVDGHEVSINPALVTSLHAAKKNQENQLLVNDVRCVVGLADGKFVSVAESCDVVRKLLREENH